MSSSQEEDYSDEEDGEEDDDIIDITDEFFTRFERLYWSKFEAAIPLGLQSTNISVLKIRGYRNALDRIDG